MGVKVEDGCVELEIDGSVFKLGLDKDGLPQFPELLKEKLPPYVPEMVEEGMKRKRDNPNQGSDYMAVSHKPWCPEMKGTGRCNCNPDLINLEIREYSGIGDGKLTCKMCDESSKGEKILYDICDDVVEDGSSDGGWQRFWVEGGDMFYWLVGIAGTDLRLLICHLCMIELGIEFPNAIECDKDSPDNHD